MTNEEKDILLAEAMRKRDTKPVGTKVSDLAYDQLNTLCKARGMTLYDLLQMFCDVAIRYMSDQHNLSPELNMLISLFDGMKDWRQSITLTDSRQRHEVAEAIYTLTDKEGKHGTRIVMVQGGQDDMFRTECYNINTIFERFFENSQPQLYKHLRLLGVSLGTNSVLETIKTVADEYMEDPDQKELRVAFENNTNDAFGKKMVNAPYVRHHHKTMDLFDREPLPTITGDEYYE